MEDKDILKLDFFDFCGSYAIFMTDAQKIKYYKQLLKQSTI